MNDLYAIELIPHWYGFFFVLYRTAHSLDRSFLYNKSVDIEK